MKIGINMQKSKYIEDYAHGVEEAEEAICEDPQNQMAYTQIIGNLE